MVHRVGPGATCPSSPQLSMQYASGEWQPMETNEAFWLSLRVSLSLLGASVLVALRSPFLHFLRWLCSRVWCGCVRTKEVNARLRPPPTKS